MQSATKNQLTHHQILTLARHHFGSSVELNHIQELTEGWFNTGYLLEMRDGSESVLKVAPPTHVPVLRYEKEMMQTEVKVMRILEGQNRIPLPQIQAVDFSRQLIDTDYFMMEKFHGKTLAGLEKELTPAEKESIHRQLGEITAHIHRNHGTFFGYPMDERLPSAVSWKSAFLSMFDRILADAIDYNAPLPRPIDEIRAIVDANSIVLDRLTTPILLHYDLWAGNVFISGELGSRKVEGIIDFERAFWGDPLAEFACNMVSFDEFGETAPYTLAYNQAAETPFIFEPDDYLRVRLYRAYIQAIMCVETVPRAYPPGMCDWIQSYIFTRLEDNLKHLEEAVS
ncbi:MAG: aminoglycoside phosphotransferase family protein [Anaerolineaceae bacterium]|nr:aminoglycoside phosphotransferase family protein [Anaerolineaceae bacterium]